MKMRLKLWSYMLRQVFLFLYRYPPKMWEAPYGNWTIRGAWYVRCKHCRKGLNEHFTYSVCPARRRSLLHYFLVWQWRRAAKFSLTTDAIHERVCAPHYGFSDYERLEALVK